MRKYRVSNRLRFITFAAAVILLISFAFAGVFNTVTAKNSYKNSFAIVTVEEGDTLWNLAREYGKPGKDVRRIVFDICSANKVSADTLYPGQTILIPIE